MFSSSAISLTWGNAASDVLDGAVARRVVDEDHLEVDAGRAGEERREAAIELVPRAVADQQHRRLGQAVLGAHRAPAWARVSVSRSHTPTLFERFLQRALALTRTMTPT